MIKNNNLIFKIFIFSLLTIVFLYSIFLFVLPFVLSSKFFVNNINTIIFHTIGINVKSEKFDFVSHPNLDFDLNFDELKVYVKNTEVLKLKNGYLKYDIKKLSFEKIGIDYLYIDEKAIKKVFNKNSSSKSFNFNLDKLPITNIKKAEIWIDNDGINSIFISLSDINLVKKQNAIVCTFEGEIISDLFRNLVNIGKQGYIFIKDNSVYAKNIQILIGVSKLYIDGKIIDSDKNNDFSVNGKDIPICDIKTSLLYFQKLKDSSKKFIENFYDFSGYMDVDIKVKEKGIFGKCIAKKLAAKTVLFDVPIFFKKVDFIFDKDSLQAAEAGILGGEKVYTSFKLSNIAKKNQEVVGNVYANLTNKSVSKYIPYLSLQGYAATSVDYSVKNKKINVNYLLKLKKDSDLHYKNAYLGLIDKNRRLFVKTLKENNTLKILHYDYSFQEGSDISNIILGDGLFIKRNGHLVPSYLTCKTNGFAPVSVTGSFGRYISGGFFNGNLKYDFEKDILTGIFILKDSLYKDFYIEKANVIAESAKMKIVANGEYLNSVFEANLEAENNFINKIHVYNMELFLDKYIFKRGDKHGKINKNHNSIKIPTPPEKLDLDIDNWVIRLNKIKRKKLELNNIIIEGSLKDNIFSFAIPQINFAKGIINANGIYNVKEKTSDVIFTAKNIDSNTVADVIFDLPNQIEGTANATLHAETKDSFDKVKAYATFSLIEGYLPKIGSTEFIIKKSNKFRRPLKFRLSDIINIDMKNMKALSSNLEGSFCFNNDSIYNAKITSSQKYLSLLVEGNYNFDSQKADLRLLGKYNNREMGRVKILFIPLPWIFKFVFKPENTLSQYKNKLKEVPPIEGAPNEQSAFRVKMGGNLNKNDVKVELKSII